MVPMRRWTILAGLALAGCAAAPPPTTAVPRPDAAAAVRTAVEALPAAERAALAELPEAERRESEDAAAIGTWGAPPSPGEAALAPLRAQLAEARAVLGFAPAFRDEAELVPYLASLHAAKPPAAYDREGFLEGLGIAAPRSPGKTDDATFAAVRQVPGYSPGAEFGGHELKSQVLAWKIARTFPRSYALLARAVNPGLEALGRLKKPWARPFVVRQTAHATGQPAGERYRRPAGFRLLFDPDVHSGLPGTAPAGRNAYGTRAIALGAGFPVEAAERVGKACDDVDFDDRLPYPRTGPVPGQSLDRHFNLARRGQDTRFVWAARHLQAAIAFGRQTAWAEAEVELGVGLHSLQDAYAHGQMSPYLHGTIGEYPDDLRYNPIGYVEVAEATRAYLRAYLAGL